MSLVAAFLYIVFLIDNRLATISSTSSGKMASLLQLDNLTDLAHNDRQFTVHELKQVFVFLPKNVEVLADIFLEIWNFITKTRDKHTPGSQEC